MKTRMMFKVGHHLYDNMMLSDDRGTPALVTEVPEEAVKSFPDWIEVGMRVRDEWCNVIDRVEAAPYWRHTEQCWRVPMASGKTRRAKDLHPYPETKTVRVTREHGTMDWDAVLGVLAGIDGITAKMEEEDA